MFMNSPNINFKLGLCNFQENKKSSPTLNNTKGKCVIYYNVSFNFSEIKCGFIIPEILSQNCLVFVAYFNIFEK